MHEDAFLRAFGAPAYDQVALFDQTELNYQDAAVFVNGDAIHAAVFGKEPLAVDLEVFGVDAHGVVALGRHGVFRRRDKGGIGRFLEKG